ncbi:universal stress protein [Bacillus thuringiensis]|uniref:universal stress protein n=1 Tax=Bacillus thuringiensis TaxID=1428 RepID=UPI0005CF1E22|nr:universal stress protein [Bacillus thuringiensis]
MFNKILLASDGSKHAIRAAENAVKLANGNLNAKVEIVYSVGATTSKEDVLHGSLDLKNGVSERQERLKSTEEILQSANVFFETKILHGEPGPTIVQYANKNKFDIVIVGSRGLNSLQEMVLGSVSHKVVKRVNCPVLIIK